MAGTISLEEHPMQTVRVYNMTPATITIRGLGAVATATKREGAIKQTLFDANFNDYATRACNSGIVVLDTAGLYVPLAESPATYYTSLSTQTATGASPVAATLAATVRAVIAANTTSAQTHTLTLPAANAVPANTVLYFFYDAATQATSIARAGSDTIDGGTSSLAINSTTVVRRLKSDGVSAWVSV